jgi:hypothetical protein
LVPRAYRFGCVVRFGRRFNTGGVWPIGAVSHALGCDFGAGGSTNRSRSRPGISLLGMRIACASAVAAPRINAKIVAAAATDTRTMQALKITAPPSPPSI